MATKPKIQPSVIYRDADGNKIPIPTSEHLDATTRKARVIASDEQLFAARLREEVRLIKKAMEGSSLQVQLTDLETTLARLKLGVTEASKATPALVRLRAEFSDLAVAFGRVLSELREHAENDHGTKLLQLLSEHEDLTTLIMRTKNSLLANTTTEIVAGAAAAATVELEYVPSIITSIEAIDATARTFTKLLEETTDYTFVAGAKDVTCVTDQSTQLLRITYKRQTI